MNAPAVNENEPLRYAVWMQLALGIGNGHVTEILAHFHSPKELFEATPAARAASGVLSKRACEKCSTVSLQDADAVLNDCRKYGITAVSFSEPCYPDCLRGLVDFPLVLYYKGALPDFDREPVFCIVGPRKVSAFGEKSAYSLGLRLAKGGMTVVSGGALGADSAAHKGALKGAGKTVAVLPCGLQHEYLCENRPLREAILKNGGCLLSESPPKAGVFRHSFQVRNRLLSGLSLGVALVEAPRKSGALITAHHACEQGRDVFVVPGNPTLECYFGSNDLLRDGARPLLHAMDIFETYSPRFPTQLHPEAAFQKTESDGQNKKVSKKSTETLSNEAKIVYNYLDKEKFTADDLAGCGLPFDALLPVLTELEIEGMIAALPGGFYTLS